MTARMTIDEIMRTAPVIPVLVLDGDHDWARLAEVFVGAGLPVLEITLRTAAALDRVCLTLGAVAGDMALAQGASAVVIAGGVGLRLADYLPRSGFRDRFIAKGRFERRMDEMPVKLITHPQPGLFGAAAAFAREHS